MSSMRYFWHTVVLRHQPTGHVGPFFVCHRWAVFSTCSCGVELTVAG